jgi:hypothetical protein
MQGLNWVLLKSKVKHLVLPSYRRRKEKYGPAAEASVQRGLIVARDLVGRNRAAVDLAWDTLGFRFQEDMLLSLELQFLWGIFCELVSDGPSFPTNGYDRVLSLLMFYLHEERGFPLDYARVMALGTQKLFNSADELFDGIAKHGRAAYRNGGDQHFVNIVLALHQNGVRDDAYARNE